MNAAVEEQILLYLKTQSPPTVSAVARELQILRPSVSRAINNLAQKGLAEKHHGKWRITSQGRTEVKRIEDYLGKTISDLGKSVASFSGIYGELSKIASAWSRQFEFFTKSKVLDSMAPKLTIPKIEAINDLMRSFTLQNEAIRQLSEVFSRAIPKFPDFKPPIEMSRLVRAINEAIPRFDLTKFEALWRAGLPPNWHDLGADGRSTQPLLQLMNETGWCLLWVPRAEIIQKLLEAEGSSARQDILIDSAKEILEDLMNVLGEIHHPELKHQKEAATEAVSSFSVGYIRAAQTLSAATLTSLIHEQFELHSSAARKQFEAIDPMKSPVVKFKTFALLALVGRALSQFDSSKNVSPPSAFNRHASVHTVLPIQFSKVNSLSALMMVVGLLRELQHLLDEDENRQSVA